ncbi:probable protein S-acyltransferase 12 [Mizuhopecten yessoensis]|uniref:Palmitoyltransferase n=1 Tax=Mizuhopecten yessoensis TaxID=6573 RepID=A0A210QRV9_MIZYE|nr:probable protein S-acyltransferase 12 [Mizuhopecten yessoensis]OWF51477.1 palmitoyltransferase ZDHHC22 [Mizuhopecten yessoensis]
MLLKERWASLQKGYNSFTKFCQKTILPHSRINRLGPWLFLLETFCLCYIGTAEIIPTLWDRYGPTFVRMNQAFTWFLGVQILMNWLCVRYVSSTYHPEIGQIHLLKRDDHSHQYTDYTLSFVEENQLNSLRHRKAPEQKRSASKNYFTWSTCKSCREVRPARCHHCNICKACVLARDHHCFFSGNCVGYKNLRHFCVFLFYSMYATVYAFLHASAYYYLELWPRTIALEILPFVTFLRNLFGQGEYHTGVLILVWWALGMFLVIGAFQFIDLVLEIPEGVTSYEFNNGIELEDSRSLLEKVRAVFGSYWLLNLIAPVHFIFPPVVDPVNWPTISGIKRAPDEFL